MIDHTCYFEGAHIVLKFCQGLNPIIQDHITCFTSGCPSDEIPREWYAAARLCDKNHIANEAVRVSSCTLCWDNSDGHECASEATSMRHYNDKPTCMLPPPPLQHLRTHHSSQHQQAQGFQTHCPKYAFVVENWGTYTPTAQDVSTSGT
jgi:hypothetical protein